MRSFRQIATSIISMVEPDLHRVSFDEIFDLIREAAEANKRESQGQPAFRVDVTDEYIDFSIYNPDAGGGSVCFESSTRARNEKDKEGDRSLLKWISNSLSRLIDLQGPRWFRFRTDQLSFKKTQRATPTKYARSPEKHGIRKPIDRGYWEVRDDKISEYVKIDQQQLGTPVG